MEKKVSLELQYELATSPVPAMSWLEYRRLMMQQWKALLDGAHSQDEPIIHAFLEQHPSMIPGAFNTIGLKSGHAPIFWSVISQPVLPSYPHRKPDFMWLSRNSAFEEPVLIEIESPSKPWFTNKGQSHSKFNQALQQVVEWKSWFDEPVNIINFQKYYKLTGELFESRTFRPSYALIYGRRSEANATPETTKIRGRLLPEHVTAMTYDRLTPDADASDLICIKLDIERRHQVVSVPPTFQLGPAFAAQLSHLHGLEAAIERNEYIHPARKVFLIERLPYWRAFAQQEVMSPIIPADSE